MIFAWWSAANAFSALFLAFYVVIIAILYRLHTGGWLRASRVLPWVFLGAAEEVEQEP